MDEQTAEMKQQTIKMDEQHKEMMNKMSSLEITIDNINNKLDKRAANIPTNDRYKERFVIMYRVAGLDTKVVDGKLRNEIIYSYRVIRRQEQSLEAKIEELEFYGYEKLDISIDSLTMPNAGYLWTAIREELVTKKNIIKHYNGFKLVNMNHNDFKTLIETIFASRKN